MSDEQHAVIAIVAAYNEADVIAQTIGDLVAQGVTVYLIDHGSTDDTVDEARAFLGRGLLEIEQLPASDRFGWADLLRHKERLAASLPGRWFLHADADELRESPWAGVSLQAGIALVEQLGYDAIDFSVFDFRPLAGAPPYERGQPLREAFTHYQPGAAFDRQQVKGWRQPPGGVDLASSGGHDVRFPGRRVFPLRFLLRHYSIRSQAHGERKVFHERKGRFLDEERALGWHVQYDALLPGVSFLRDPETLRCFDADEARLSLVLQHRGVDALEAALTEANGRVTSLAEIVQAREVQVRALEAELVSRTAELAALRDTHASERAATLARHASERAATEAWYASESVKLSAELSAERAATEARHASEREATEAQYASEQARGEARHASERTRQEAERAALVAHHAREIDGLERALADVEIRLDALLASRTWRWAAPARLAWRVMGRR